MGDVIKCKHANADHKNCFARTKKGECICLTDCNFKDGKCHFFKPKQKKEGGK